MALTPRDPNKSADDLVRLQRKFQRGEALTPQEQQVLGEAILVVAGYGLYGLSKAIAWSAKRVGELFDRIASPETAEGLRRLAEDLEVQRRALQRSQESVEAEFRESER